MTLVVVRASAPAAAPGPTRRRGASRWPGAGRDAGVDPTRRSPSTPAAIDALAGDRSGTWQALAAVVEASAYGGRHPTPEDDRQLRASMRALRAELPRGGVPVRPGAAQAGRCARASSKVAPAASRGR